MQARTIQKIDNEIEALHTRRQAEIEKEQAKHEKTRQQRVAAAAEAAQASLKDEYAALVTAGQAIENRTRELEDALAELDRQRNDYQSAYEIVSGNLSREGATREEVLECFESLERPDRLKIATVISQTGSVHGTLHILENTVLNSSDQRTKLSHANLAVIVLRNKLAA